MVHLLQKASSWLARIFLEPVIFADIASVLAQLRSTLAATWPAEKALVSRVKQIKHETEQVLSQQYNGRTVNIIGEINNVLAASTQ